MPGHTIFRKCIWTLAYVSQTLPSPSKARSGGVTLQGPLLHRWIVRTVANIPRCATVL
jgi:hypothetical protein